MSGNKKKKKKKPQRIDGFKRHAQTWTHSWRGRFTLVAKNHIPADPSELPLRGTAVEFAFPYARQCTVSCNNYTSFHTQIRGQSSTRRERGKKKRKGNSIQHSYHPLPLQFSNDRYFFDQQKNRQINKEGKLSRIK